MSKPDNKWHKGPPPSVGWWPCRAQQYDGEWVTVGDLRWHDGRRWSIHCDQQDAEDGMLNDFARMSPAFPDPAIEWQHRPASWPKRSRT